MPARLDALDKQLIELLKVNARLPVVKIAQALGCARSTVQLRLKALEEDGTITGYTVGLGRAKPAARIRAVLLIGIDSRHEPEILKAMSRRHEIDKIHTVSGRYDLCAMLSTESTDELDAVIDRIRALKGVNETVSTILLTCKLDRPE